MSLMNDLIRAAKAAQREAERQERLRIRAEKERQREIERQRKALEKEVRDAERAHKQQIAAEKAAHIQRCKEQAKQRTDECQSEIAALEGILRASLSGTHVPDLSAVKLAFPRPMPSTPRYEAIPPEPAPLDLPDRPAEVQLPPEPSIDDTSYKKALGLLKTAKRREAVQGQFDSDHQEWTAKVSRIKAQQAEALSRWESETEAIVQEQARQRTEWEKTSAEVSRRNAELGEEQKRAVEEWKAQKRAFERSIDQLGGTYAQGEPDAVAMYVEIALSQSTYPDYFPNGVTAHYSSESKELLIDRSLPSPALLPSLREITYVQTRDEFVEKPIPKTQAAQMFDGMVYQSALRSVFEALSADTRKHVQGVVFNGWVEASDPATGKAIRPCIASFHATREEFDQLDLSQVDPKACFKKLKGVAAAKLHQLAPVQPLIQFSKDDDRFVEGRDVSTGLDQSTNLAAMDWEDFEHLIRELFEAEFGSGGSEVRITRASRDRGVDAIAFDPDPIRGGKFVIQAKRYTRTVGVDAVRDLYGTVINEGANKGILVTTAEYGPDAYDFVKDKPLTLVSGGELLFLLEKHGHRARIDLAEARLLNAD